MGLGWDSKGITLHYVGLSAFRVAFCGIRVGLVWDYGVTVGLEWDYGGDVGLFGIRMGLGLHCSTVMLEDCLQAALL